MLSEMLVRSFFKQDSRRGCVTECQSDHTVWFLSVATKRKQFNRRSTILVIKSGERSGRFAEITKLLRLRWRFDWCCYDESIHWRLSCFARNLQSNVLIAVSLLQQWVSDSLRLNSNLKENRVQSRNAMFIFWVIEKCFMRRCSRDETRKNQVWPLSIMWIGVKMYLSQRRSLVLRRLYLNDVHYIM